MEGGEEVAVEFSLPDLPYPVDALEPYIDAQTMEIHHGRHHQTYVNKLNEALKKHPEISVSSVEELLRKLESVPEDIRVAIRNNGGGHANHSLFWRIMKKNGGGEPKGELLKAIEKKFGSFSKFQEEFSQKAATHFGSGWAFLVVNGFKELEVYSLPNQDSPYLKGHIPILGLDVWEHAYYLKYQNKRPEYIKNWWNTINWEEVEENYQKALKEV